MFKQIPVFGEPVDLRAGILCLQAGTLDVGPAGNRQSQIGNQELIGVLCEEREVAGNSPEPVAGQHNQGSTSAPPPPPMPPRGQPNKPAVAGFILGSIAIVVGFGGVCLGPLTLVAGIILGTTGLILSIVGLNRSRKTKTGRGLAIAGLIINLAWLVFVVAMMSIAIYYRPSRLPAGVGT